MGRLQILFQVADPRLDFGGPQPVVEFGAQRRYDLRRIPYPDLVRWPFVDYCLSRDYDVMSDTLKIRQAGFASSLDSEVMFLRLFSEFRAMRVIP